ncbi:MAG: FeoA family protein [Candidatus Bathyarchaeia archaeon]|nr:FeoA family protein [Candidatus Bathyarchaeia archaeon]
MKRENSKKNEVALTALRKGEVGTVSSVRAGYGRDRVFEKRLMDMGLTPGTKVTVVKSAPFHGPIEISVRGSRLALGRGLAGRIFVEKEKK